MFKKIVVVGAGYVGMSIATLCSQKYDTTIVELDNKKINLLLNKISPISDDLIQEFLIKNFHNIKISNNLDESINNSDLIVLALPTNYDASKDYFDTSVIEKTIERINERPTKIPILIKSTIPIGFTKKMQANFPELSIIFSPEFLREGSALLDNLNPSRIIVGNKKKIGLEISQLFESLAENSPKIILMEESEAEAVKLFANTYLASRVSFFNELDTFCMSKKIDTRSVIEGVSSDPRIGEGYNNPSFGYGGYCLPKDTKQLLSNFGELPQNIFSSIVKSNATRKDFITESIIALNPEIVGIYRLIMKSNSDNFRESAIYDIMNKMNREGIKMIVYEPLVLNDKDQFYKIENNIKKFKSQSDIIVTNRFTKELDDVLEKTFSRDIFNEN